MSNITRRKGDVEGETITFVVPDKFKAWIKEVDGAGCPRIEARHILPNGSGSANVATWEAFEASEHYKAEDIYARLHEDAQALGGEQKYLLLAFRTGGKSPWGRYNLSIDGGATDGVNLGQRVGRDELLSQAYAHLESSIGSLLNGFDKSQTALVNIVANLNKSLEEMRLDHANMWATVREAQNLNLEAKRQDEELAQKKAHREMLGEVASKAVPLIVSAVMAKLAEMGGDKEARVKLAKESKLEGLTDLFTSLDDAQRATIFSSLRPEQIALVSALIDKAEAHTEKKNSTPAHDEPGKGGAAS